MRHICFAAPIRVLLVVVTIVALTSHVAGSPPDKPHVSIAVQRQTSPSAIISLTPPAIAQEGFTAMLSADVQGAGPLALQWFLDGAKIESATNAVLVRPVLERSDEGSYTVQVTNQAGRATSDPALLLVANVKPASFMNLRVNAPTGGVLQIHYTDSLASNALWRPLAGVTSSVAPLVVVDADVANATQRFYRTPVPQGLDGRLVPGWAFSDATGSVHVVEFIDPSAGITYWRTLRTLTLPESPFLFVDTYAPATASRAYRTTMIESPSRRRVGRLIYSVRWILPADVYATVVQTNRAGIAAIGVSFDDAEHALQMPTNALAGSWIALGDQRVMTGTNGDFTVDVPVGINHGFVLPERGSRSTQADATFEVSQLSLPGETPTPILVRFDYAEPLSMDSSFIPELRAAEVICGNPGVHVGNNAPCCLDYNGYFSTDCKDTTGGTDAMRVLHYVGSTCFQRVNAGLCHREFNSHAIGFRVPGLNCYSNHKYRNCQNVDMNAGTSFTILSSATTVRCGETIDLTIHNNSPANETELSLGPLSWNNLGTLTGARVSPNSSTSYTLRHYDDFADPPFHVEDDVIQYTAPKRKELDPGVEEIKVQMRVSAGGIVRTLEITVSCGNCETDPDVISIPNMVSIPSGTFTMGSPASEPARDSVEGPQTRVTLSGFCMGRYEVTQSEYVAMMGSNPSEFTGGLNCPVETVSWSDAVAYCSALTERERSAGRLPSGWQYRLPTEAEWEYACRARTTTAFHYGDELLSGMATFRGPYEYPPCGDQTYFCTDPFGFYRGRTTPVGSYAPNAWGLYDMHGNVQEWCADWFSFSLSGGNVTDPQGPATGESRVLRGGGWGSYAGGCRSANRNSFGPGGRGPDVGFRVVLVPVP